MDVISPSSPSDQDKGFAASRLMQDLGEFDIENFTDQTDCQVTDLADLGTAESGLAQLRHDRLRRQAIREKARRRCRPPLGFVRCLPTHCGYQTNQRVCMRNRRSSRNA